MPPENDQKTQAIAICMATYNPPLQLFRRQIESIRNQTCANWHCFISDDASSPEAIQQVRETIGADSRFTLSVSAARQGFFHNFERSLQMVTAEFSYVALADQDDFWQPNKLQMLLEQFGANTTLVYSDARIVDAAGRVISESAFSQRESNCSDLPSLVLSNSVTGAAALFSAGILPRALPFPALTGRLAHDHWLSCVAMASGQVKYFPLCLYDYVQHGGNAIGYDHAVKPSWLKLLYFGLRVAATRRGRQAAEVIFRQDVSKITVLASEILQRCSPRLSLEDRTGLQQLANLAPTLRTLLWLVRRGLKTARLTAGAEYHLAFGLWGQYLSKFKL